jgi:hypothetical protein
MNESNHPIQGLGEMGPHPLGHSRWSVSATLSKPMPEPLCM